MIIERQANPYDCLSFSFRNLRQKNEYLDSENYFSNTFKKL